MQRRLWYAYLFRLFTLGLGVLVSINLTFGGYLRTRIQTCASSGKWRYELNSSLIELEFWGKFNHNTIELPLNFWLTHFRHT